MCREDWSASDPPTPEAALTVARPVLAPLRRFLGTEVAGASVLLLATVTALIWANAAPDAYADVWGGHAVARVVDQGLMTIFFLVIGLEVKREVVAGELSTRGRALLPVFAALGGVVVPALVFVAITRGSGASAGWGIPIATDVAFALAALHALGARVPAPLLAFMLGVAVVDDIVAIAVVAVAYTDGLAPGWLGLAALALLAMVALRRRGVGSPALHTALGVVVWVAVYRSGVHATIAGVAIAMTVPVRARLHSPLGRLERALHPWSSFLVLPVFALANAGIRLDAGALHAATETPVALAAGVGLVLGKAIGLTGGTALAVRLRVAALPEGVGWAHVAGLGVVAGIGFTVALFVADLAYRDPDLVAAAKVGVLAGSVVAATLGMLLLRAVSRRSEGAGARE